MCVCLQVHLAKDLSRKLLWQMFWKGEFFAIFKIYHPNAESVEIHLELLVFDFCWGCQTGFPIGCVGFWGPPDPQEGPSKLGRLEVKSAHPIIMALRCLPPPEIAGLTIRGWSTNHHWFPGKPGLCFWWG